MKVCLLFNPKAGSAGQLDALKHALMRRYRVTLVETKDADDLNRKAQEAAAGDYRMVAVAGGDGTLHAVVNALGPNFPKSPLAFLPLGTGNDLCRTLGVPLDPEEAARKLRRHRARRIDVVKVEGCCAKYMVNAATGGFSGQVAADTTAEVKKAWGPFAYLRSAAGPVAERASYTLTIRFDGGEPETFDALNIVVANGRTAAGGVVVAPLANPEDGLLDVVIVKNADFFDLSVITARLMAGDYLADENVVHRRAKRVEITSDPPLPMSVDGELTEVDRVTFAVEPMAVRVVPGKDYRPDPAKRAVALGPAQLFFGAVAEGLWLLSRATRWPGVGVGIAVASVLLFALLTRSVLAGGWGDTNAAAYAWATPRADGWPPLASRLGDPLISGGLVALVAGGLAYRRIIPVSLAVVAVLAGLAATELILKPVFASARPESAPASMGYSYPSGHALRGAGVYSFLAILIAHLGTRRRRWAVVAGLLVLAVAVPVSRVFLGVHWLTDVVAGGLLGLAWAFAVAAVVFPRADFTPPARSTSDTA